MVLSSITVRMMNPTIRFKSWDTTSLVSFEFSLKISTHIWLADQVINDDTSYYCVLFQTFRINMRRVY